MNKFIYFLFASIIILEWNLDFFPRVVKWVPELIFMAAAVLVLANFSSKKPVAFQGKYLMLIVFNLLLIVIGIIINKVQPGVIFNGIRNFLKFVPIFFLPIVYSFSDEEIKKQIKFLFTLVLMQIPLAIIQRFVLYADKKHGDMVSGTVGNSKILSGIMLWAIAVIFAFYLKQKISMRYMVIISILLLIPIILSETAGSLFLLPLAFIAPLLFSNIGRNNPKLIIVTIVSGSLLFSFLVIGYDQFYGKRWDSGGLITLITEGKVIEHEMDAEKGGEYEVGIGRLAAIDRAVEKLWELDPIKLLVGIGIGNASDSFNKNLKGEYYEKYRKDGVLKHTVSNFIWNFGLIGVALFFTFWYMVFKDAQALSLRSDISGVIALGFLGILAIVLLQTIYINVILNNLLGCLFAYFSGYIAAQRVWLYLR